MHGTPSVAFRAAGGVTESVRDGETGLLVAAQRRLRARRRRACSATRPCAAGSAERRGRSPTATGGTRQRRGSRGCSWRRVGRGAEVSDRRTAGRTAARPGRVGRRLLVRRHDEPSRRRRQDRKPRERPRRDPRSCPCQPTSSPRPSGHESKGRARRGAAFRTAAPPHPRTRPAGDEHVDAAARSTRDQGRPRRPQAAGADTGAHPAGHPDSTSPAPGDLDGAVDRAAADPAGRAGPGPAVHRAERRKAASSRPVARAGRPTAADRGVLRRQHRAADDQPVVRDDVAREEPPRPGRGRSAGVPDRTAERAPRQSQQVTVAARSADRRRTSRQAPGRHGVPAGRPPPTPGRAGQGDLQQATPATTARAAAVAVGQPAASRSGAAAQPDRREGRRQRDELLPVAQQAGTRHRGHQPLQQRRGPRDGAPQQSERQTDAARTASSRRERAGPRRPHAGAGRAARPAAAARHGEGRVPAVRDDVRVPHPAQSQQRRPSTPPGAQRGPRRPRPTRRRPAAARVQQAGQPPRRVQHQPAPDATASRRRAPQVPGPPGDQQDREAPAGRRSGSARRHASSRTTRGGRRPARPAGDGPRPPARAARRRPAAAPSDRAPAARRRTGSRRQPSPRPAGPRPTRSGISRAAPGARSTSVATRTSFCSSCAGTTRRGGGRHRVQRHRARQVGAQPELVPREARVRDEHHVVAEDVARPECRAEDEQAQQHRPGGHRPRAHRVDVPSSAGVPGLWCAGPADAVTLRPRRRRDSPRVRRPHGRHLSRRRRAPRARHLAPPGPRRPAGPAGPGSRSGWRWPTSSATR